MENQTKRYDVVLVDFGINTIGSEQAGRRPAIVVQNDIGNHFSTTTIVMPLTSQVKDLNQSTHTLIKKGKENGLKRDSMVLAECIRQISKKRIIKCLGKITDFNEKKEIRRVYNASFGEWILGGLYELYRNDNWRSNEEV